MYIHNSIAFLACNDLIELLIYELQNGERPAIGSKVNVMLLRSFRWYNSSSFMYGKSVRKSGKWYGSISFKCCCRVLLVLLPSVTGITEEDACDNFGGVRKIEFEGRAGPSSG